MRKYRTSSSSVAPSSAASSSAAAPSSIGDDVYSGVALFGRGTALFSAIIATVIGIVFICVGISIIRKKSRSVKGTVNKDSTCDNNTGICTVYVNYVYNGQNYHNSAYSYPGDNSISYMKGTSIGIIVDPTNGNVVGLGEEVSTSSAAWIMIIGSVLLILICWVWFYFTMESKGFAAVTGGVGLLDDVFNR